MFKRYCIWAAIILFAAPGDLCAQIGRPKSEFFDHKKLEIMSGYALIGGDEYLSVGGTLPLNKITSFGTRMHFRMNNKNVTSWTVQYQRTYETMVYAFARFEGNIMLNWQMDLRLSLSTGLGVVDLLDDVPCYEINAIEPVLLIHPDVSILYKLANNFHASLSFAFMHSPTFHQEHLRQLPKPLLGFNLRMYPWS